MNSSEEKIAARKRKKAEYDRAYRVARREVVRARKKAYYEANKAHDNAKSREWRKDNAERAKVNARRSYEKDCDKYRARAKAQYEADKPRAIAKARERKKSNPRLYHHHALVKNYGISVDDYDFMLRRQSNVCAICKDQCKTGKRLCVDHDHKTGEIRGLLCNNCNMAIGKLRDNIHILQSAILYLKGSKDERARTWKAIA